jgi:hypothetical protein
MFKYRYEKNQAKPTPNRSPKLQAELKQCRFHMFVDRKYFLAGRKEYTEVENSANLEKSKSRRFAGRKYFFMGRKESITLTTC